MLMIVLIVLLLLAFGGGVAITDIADGEPAEASGFSGWC